MSVAIKKSGFVWMMMIALCGAASAQAEDWTQWRGKDRLGIWTETGILEKFPEKGLEITWRIPLGSGYSGPVVSSGRVITMDYRAKPDTEIAEAIERVICLNEETGELLWADEWQTHYREIMGSYRTGPRATPTIDDDRVYAIGAAGHIRCININSGKLIQLLYLTLN